MHETWKEDIPFYIAGTLSPQRAAELEQHLAECESCQKTLEEWRLIGMAVHTQAAEWGRGLPPLAAHVRKAILEDQIPLPPTQEELPPLRVVPGTQRVRPAAQVTRSRRIPAPLTLVASVVTAVLFIGLLLAFFANNDDQTADTDEIVLAPTEETLNPVTVTFTVPAPTRTPRPFATVTPNVLLPTLRGAQASAIPPSPTPVPSITVPTYTPVTTAPALNTALPVAPSADASSAAMATIPACEVSPATDIYVAIVASPADSETVIAQLAPDETLPVIRYDLDGWLQIPDVGGIAIENVTLYGECSAILSGVSDDEPVFRVQMDGDTVTVNWSVVGSVTVALYADDVTGIPFDELPPSLDRETNLPATGATTLMVPTAFEGVQVSVRLSAGDTILVEPLTLRK